MMKRVFAALEDFYYRKIVKTLLKTSKLGHGVVVTGAESGVNFEHIYNNMPQGSYLIGKIVDKALLNLTAVEATRGRKENIKNILWNEIQNNKSKGRTTRVLDLASGGARYLRELAEEHRLGDVESVCIDKDLSCVKLGEGLSAKENLKNIRFFRGNIFQLNRLKFFASRLDWTPNVVIASGLLIYFNNEKAEQMIKEIYGVLPSDGLFVFSSYEKLNTRKLMRKTMAVSSGEEWVLYYRKPEYWREILRQIGFKDIFISRDKWLMNNICSARK